MSNKSPRMYQYTQKGSILTVGIDINGRIFSHIERDGKVLARDMYMRVPSETTLNRSGWVRHYE